MVSAPVAFSAAIAGTLLYGSASVSQAYAAGRATGPRILRHPAYVAGLVGDGLAWVASVVALGGLAVFAVQSLLAGSLAVTVVLARLVLGVGMSRVATGAVVGVTAGLALVGWSAGAESSQPAPGWFTAALAGVLLAAVIAGVASYRRAGSIRLAVVAAIAFSGAALGARALHPSASDWGAIVTSPLTWLILACGITGAVLYARSLERGPVGPATAALWVVEVLFPGGVGLLVLGDTVRPGMAGAAAAGVLLAVAGTVALAYGAPVSAGAAVDPPSAEPSPWPPARHPPPG